MQYSRWITEDGVRRVCSNRSESGFAQKADGKNDSSAIMYLPYQRSEKPPKKHARHKPLQCLHIPRFVSTLAKQSAVRF